MCRSTEESGRYALLVMVLHEVKHTGTVAAVLLPAAGYCSGRFTTLYNSTQRVIKTHLVIYIVKVAYVYVIPIGSGVIDFSDETYLFVSFFFSLYGPVPELNRNHLGHVATERVNTF